MRYGWVSFTTDYGTVDGFVAACKGVLARRAPGVAVLDVTHEVPPQDVRRGAAVLAQTVPWLPPAVHLAVVDPGVGTDRRGVAVVTAGGVLVGPDNGLLVPAADALGGVTAAYALTDPAYHLPHVSATFHGRDVFAPVAAALCTGLAPDRLGPPARDLVRLPDLPVSAGPDGLRSPVLSVDGFGTLQLAATAAHLTGLDGELEVAGRPARRGRTFADVAPGELVVLVDSAGHVAVAVNRGSAAAVLGIGPDGEVVIRPRSRSGARDSL